MVKRMMNAKQHEMTLFNHLKELRKRLALAFIFFFIASAICYNFAQVIYTFLTQPLIQIYSGDSSRKLIFTGLTEAFFVHIKIAFFAGFICSFPFTAFQLYRFIAPGLYKDERRVFAPYLFVAPILFAAGAALVYYYVMPLAWSFFISFEQLGDESSLPIMLEARISEYLSLVMSLIMGFGLAFQLPLILVFLAQLGVVKGTWLAKVRRYAIVVIFIIAAFLTPPDVISQIALAIPLLLLYEVSVIVCKRIEKVKENNARY
jgi:sec-independent protein translocase protein TatC